MGQQRAGEDAGARVEVVFETVDLQQGREAGFQFPDLFLEAFKVAAGRGFDPALDKQIGRFARGVGHGEPGDGEDEPAAVAHEAALVAVAANIVD